MANNFHDTYGLLVVGVDIHQGLQFLPPLPPFPYPFWFGELNAVHPFWAGGNQNTKTQINGTNSVKDQHNPILLWPHFPLFPFNIIFPLDVLFGSQNCWIPKLSVMAEGAPMTAALGQAISVNLDCHTPCKLPTGATLQPGTVMTSVTWEDFLVGLMRAVISAIIDVFIFAITGGFNEVDMTKGAPLLQQVVEKAIGRIIPFPPDAEHAGQYLAAVGVFLGKTLPGTSPQALLGKAIEAIGIPPPAGPNGATWGDVFGKDVVGVAPADKNNTIEGVATNMLKNLFPHL